MLINEFSGLGSVSCKTIRKALKNDLGYSYKILKILNLIDLRG